MRLLSLITLYAVLGLHAGQVTFAATSELQVPQSRAAQKTKGTIQADSSDRVVPPFGTQTPARMQLNPQLKTPFDRVIRPTLDQILKQTTGGSATVGKAVQRPVARDAVAGTSIGLPTFVAAPFQTLQSSVDTTQLFATVTGDFNNDGKPDLVAVQAGGTITVYLNPGSFQDFSRVTPLPADSRLSAQLPNIAAVVAADMNGDGNLDLVGQDISNGQIVIWLGHGDGTFAEAATYLISPTSGTNWFDGGSMLVGDFNGDGKLDVVALTIGLNFDNTVTTPITVQSYINAGDGTLILPKTETDTTFNDFYYTNVQQAAVVTGSSGGISGIAFLMQNMGSNVPANTGANVLYIASHGDGTFSTPIEPTSATISDAKDVAISSFLPTNLNVSAKLAATSPVTDLVFLTGDGAVYDTIFTPGTESAILPAPVVLVGANASTKTASGIKESIPNAYLLNLADMNNDGSLDLVVYTFGSTLIFPNTGSGTYGPPTQLVGGIGGDQQAAPADFEGSGYNSFFWADSTQNEIGYYRNFGAAHPGAFYAATPVSGTNASGAISYAELGGNILVQAAGDFNGDGLQDVIAYDLTNAAANGGYPDVVVGFNNGKPNSGNQTNNFTFKTVLTAQTLKNLNAAFIEPVTVSSGGASSFLLVTGYGLEIISADSTGAFGAPVPLNLGLSLQCTLNYADVGDINGDGAPDIVVAYGGDASCPSHGSMPSGYFTLLGAGNGTFQPATFTQLGGALYKPRLINFTGAPGNLDLAMIDLDPVDGIYTVYTVPNSADGSGTFDLDYQSQSATGYVVSDIVPGDFNNDGKQDLTLLTEGQNVPFSFKPVPNTTGVLLLPSTGAPKGFFTFGLPTLVDNGFYSIAGSYADFNGTGYPALVVTAVQTIAGIDNPFGRPPFVPLVHILANQHGTLGPVITELDSAEQVQTAYTFVGNFGNTGGNDLLVTSNVNTAEFLNQGADTLALAASASTPAQGSTVTFIATESQATTGYAATGSVTFSENGATLGAAAIANNTATFITSSLAPGANTITANYSGDEFHNPSSAKVTVTVAPTAPMFTVFAPVQSVTLQQGATGTVTLNLQANGTFTGAVAFTCSGLPAAASCSVNPASLTLGTNQSGTVSVIVSTTAKNNTFQATNGAIGRMGKIGGVSIAGLLLFMLPRRRRIVSVLTLIMLAVLSLGSFTMLSGCSGGSGDKYPGTPVGSSTFTVTATSGAITQTQTIALSITAAQN